MTIVSAPCAAPARNKGLAQITSFLKPVTKVNKSLVIVLRTPVIKSPARPGNIVPADQVVQGGASEFSTSLRRQGRIECLFATLHVQTQLVRELPANRHGRIGAAPKRTRKFSIAKIGAERQAGQ